MTPFAIDPNPAFEAYYTALYGERWKTLRKSLLCPIGSVPYNDGLVIPYYLDSASILAAQSLRLPELDSALSVPGSVPPERCRPLILDACAAPGGKTLVIASSMKEGTELLANDLSASRRRRLSLVLDKHLPPEKRCRVKVSGFDAAAAAGRKSERGRFAAILLDAPCSSERHVLNDTAALAAWTPARPRFLARRQWALLSSAFLLLAPGGSLVYAVCSINPEENDGPVRRLMEKYGPESLLPCCILDKPDMAEGEATEYGRIILPDRADGAGPMYIARFTKALGREWGMENREWGSVR